LYVCLCNAVTEKQIREAVCDGAASVCDLSARLGVATGCGCCRTSAAEVLDEALQIGNLPENRVAA
jgi:bacterioferritin-associated ferredoxin